jgi:D-hydroxyproline dehydrogenase subunit beta
MMLDDRPVKPAPRPRVQSGVRPIQPRHCVVIGAGVLGASVAARLAGSGMRVTLLEADQPGRATSRWSFAWVNSNDKGPRPYHDLNRAGLRAWAELAPGLDGAAWYRPVGHIELATDGPRLATSAGAALAARVRRLAGWGYPARLIDAAEAAEIEPALLPPGPGAVAAWFPGEAYLLTEPLVDRLVTSATAYGATVLTGEAGRVTGLSPGRVRTAAGAGLEPDEIVCCAGRWTPQVTALAGAVAPVPLVAWETPGATAPGLVVRVGPVGPDGPARVIHTPQLALRPHPGGLLHLEAPDAAVDLHTPDAELRRWAAELLQRARRTVRGAEHATVAGYQVCVRPMPVDGQSVVGRLPGAEWLYVAVTHSGVTLAAHLSRLIAAELATGVPRAELAPYRPDRFAGTAVPITGAITGPSTAR